MADTLTECPPTNDGQTEFPPPPNIRIREFLKSQQRRSPARGNAADIANAPRSGQQNLDDNDSSASGDEQRQNDNQSPPPNCSICLGRVKSKCFTDSCMHQFCFSCLLEWSKIKPECPLCKASFKSIIHNVTSMDSYDEYKVEEQQRHVSWFNIPNNLQPLDIILTAQLPSYRNVYRPEVMGQQIQQNRIFSLFLHESPLTERFARIFGDDSIPPRHSGTPWRSYIYLRRLYAMPLTDINDRRRTITADFYRANPAQIQRLMPWLNRELLSVVPSSPYTIGVLMRTIDGLIQNYDMTSRSFRRRVHQYVYNHTDHFIHELVNFARSPYDMIGYDRNVLYSPMFEDDVHVVALSSSDESDLIATSAVLPAIAANTSLATQMVVRGFAMVTEAAPTPLAPSTTSSNSSNSSSSSSSSGSNVDRQPVITNGGGVSAATETDATAALTATVIDSSSDSSDVVISNEGSAFVPLSWRMLQPGSSGLAPSNGDAQSRDEPLTLVYSSSEDESEEVSAYSKNQVAGALTFDRSGARISPNTLRKNNSGRTVIVSVNFGGRGSSTATIGETPTPSDAPSGSELNATPAEELTVPRTQTTTTPEVAQTVQVVTSELTATPAVTAVPTPAIQSTSAALAPSVEQTPSVTAAANVIDDSDSDECVFVCAKKPPHLRTPEYVELNSESDSDVVFVNEEKLPISPPVKIETQTNGFSPSQPFWDILASMQLPNTSSFVLGDDAPATNKSRIVEMKPGAHTGCRDMMWSSVISKNPFGRALHKMDESQPSTSAGTGRRRKYPRYLKSYVHSKTWYDDTDSDDPDEVPLKRLMTTKPKRKEKTVHDASSSSHSTGPDSTDAGTSHSSSDDDLSSSSHEEYSLPVNRVAATAGKKSKLSPNRKSKVTKTNKRKAGKSKRSKKSKVSRESKQAKESASSPNCPENET